MTIRLINNRPCSIQPDDPLRSPPGTRWQEVAGDPVHANVSKVAELILEARNFSVLLDAPKAMPTDWGFTVRAVGSGNDLSLGEPFDGLVLELDSDAYLVWIGINLPHYAWVGLSEGGEYSALLRCIDCAYLDSARDNQMDRLFEPPTATGPLAPPRGRKRARPNETQDERRERRSAELAEQRQQHKGGMAGASRPPQTPLSNPIFQNQGEPK